MPGPKPKYPVELTTEEEEELRRLVRSHKTPQVKAKCARILLTAFDHPQWSNQQIAQGAGTVDRVVRHWRRRWWETRSIEDLPRSGRPRGFFPLRCAPKPRRWPVAARVRRRCGWRDGAMPR